MYSRAAQVVNHYPQPAFTNVSDTMSSKNRGRSTTLIAVRLMYAALASFTWRKLNVGSGRLPDTDDFRSARLIKVDPTHSCRATTFAHCVSSPVTTFPDRKITRLLRPRPRKLNHLCPFGDVLPNERAEFLGRAGHQFHALLQKFLAQAGVAQDAHDFTV